MNDLFDFKARFDSKKNSEVLGRMFIALNLGNIAILSIIIPKNIIRIDQNTKWMCKKITFLSAAYCYFKKIFVIIPSLQKQTP